MRDSITILGAGLAGTLAAIYLARRGLAVSIFERRPDLRAQDIPAGRSINLALAQRGLSALRQAGLQDEARKLIIPMKGRMLHEQSATPIFQPYGKNENEEIYSISREGLNVLLLNTAEEKYGIHIRFRQRCLGVAWEPGELRMRSESDGREYGLPLRRVIAADGAGSAVRRAMAASGKIEAAEQYLKHGYKELSIPPDLKGRHRIERNALHIWPRSDYMLIALPNLDGSFTVTLFLALEGEESFEALATADRVQTFFSRQFPDTVKLLPNLSEDFFSNPTGHMVTVRCAPWSISDRILLLGDAAHSVVPFHGQGMNCAFEDCRVLDELLESAGDDWTGLFEDFYASRKINAEAIADMAIENYVEMRDTVRDPRFHLKKTIAWELERRLPRHFIPRYSMVMFHDDIPYARAQQRGMIQAELLEELSRDAQQLGDVDFELGERLTTKRLDPLPCAPIR